MSLKVLANSQDIAADFFKRSKIISTNLSIISLCNF